jgi:hypothetical protein
MPKPKKEMLIKNNMRAVLLPGTPVSMPVTGIRRSPVTGMITVGVGGAGTGVDGGNGVTGVSVGGIGVRVGGTRV